MYTALNDHEGVFQMLINGADPSLLSLSLDIDSRNNDGVTPLMTADDFCRQIAFEMLIQNGADPSLKHNKLQPQQWIQFARLCCITGGNTYIINKWLSLGLDVDSRNNAGATPLMVATYCDKQSAFKMLIQNGTDPSLKDKGGFRGLLYSAAKDRNTSVLTLIQGAMMVSQVLIQNGADPSLR